MMQEIEVWVIVNQDGEYAVACNDDGDLTTAYEETIGELADAAGIRRVKVTIKVPLPVVLEMEGQCAEDETPTLTVK